MTIERAAWKGENREHYGDQVIADYNRALGSALEKASEGGVSVSETHFNEIALRCLPEGEDREILLDEFRRHPDSRFSDSALVALAACAQDDGQAQSQEEEADNDDVRGETGAETSEPSPRAPGWRESVSYPDHLAPQSIQLLDHIAALTPLPDMADRYSRMSTFVDRALEQGLITRVEYDRLRTDLANNL